ncbi:MAG: aminoglycoside 6-adenylyltransferase [Quadrisphaera sp.]
MTWQEELAAHALRAAQREPGVAEVVLAGSLADGSGVDPWSDVDLHVRLADDGPTRFDPVRWVGRFGGPWALTSQPAPEGRVVRVVYDDGRRLDVVVSGHEVAASPPGDAELMEVRQAAALAVVKLARGDLLIGMHLALGVVQRCLVQAMVLRDQQLGTAHHRSGGPFNEVVERLGGLRRHPWTADGGMALVRDAAREHDDLAVQLDPSYAADWSGLEALLRQAGR